MDRERFCGSADPQRGTNCLEAPGHAGAHQSLSVRWAEATGRDARRDSPVTVTEDEAMRRAARIYADAKVRIATEQAIRDAQRPQSENENAPAAGSHQREGEINTPMEDDDDH